MPAYSSIYLRLLYSCYTFCFVPSRAPAPVAQTNNRHLLRFLRELGLLRAALGGSDPETVVDSDPPSDPEKDWVRGLAQRATDPEFKERKKKGPFVVSQTKLTQTGEGLND